MTAFSYYGATNDISGVTTWLEGLLRHLADLHEPTSLHLHHFGQHPHEGTLCQAATSLGIQVSAITLPSTTRLAVRDTLDFLNRTRPSVFLPQALPAPHFAACLAANAGLPWVLTIHSDDPEYWALADKAAPTREHGVWVAVSEAIAAEARHRYPDADVRIIPYGVQIPSESAIFRSDPFLIAYSGRMVEEQKRVHKVLDVFMAACHLSNKIQAVFIGDGRERVALEKRVAVAGLADRIRFTGRLTPEEAGIKLLEAQAFLLMSDFEGLPVALIEAMARGVVPVVRHIRSGIPEVVHHETTGLLMDENPRSAAEALADLADNQDSWQAMSHAARGIIEQGYSQESCMRQWIGLIAELSARSTVRYPLPVPVFPKLPAYDKRLWKFDQRTPVSLRKFKRKLEKFMTTFKS